MRGALCFLSAVLCFSAVQAFAAPKTERCLSYFSVGDSACDNAPFEETPEPVKPPVAPEVPEVDAPKVAPAPPPVIPSGKPEKTFDEKVDDFLANHGKPPREFAEFNLNPTLENALRWAMKQREIMDRNRQITAAWGQAQTILNEREKSGEELPEYDALPEIPDFGVPLAQGFEQFSDVTPSQSNVEPEFAGLNQYFGKPSGVSTESNGVGISTGTTSAVDGRIGGAVMEQARVGSALVPISISYYFSAQCPFCKKFEPGFNALVKSLGDRVQVTCVDMTPGEKRLENIRGKVDCVWRPLVPGEMKAKGVVSTPTLIVDRHIEGRGEEKIVGAVSIEKLREFLLKGAS